jgi:hypothetical protein
MTEKLRWLIRGRAESLFLKLETNESFGVKVDK